MTVVAEFTVPADAFPLGVAFGRLEDATVELERFVPIDEGVMPYLWVHGATAEQIEAAFADPDSEHRVEILDSIDDEHLLRVTWLDDPGDLLGALADADVSLLTGAGDATEWRFEVRAPGREALAAFETACREAGITPQLVSLHSAVPIEPPDRGGLTEKQHEAVLLAYRRGYFDTPRRADLEELATELDISRQAFASRLRRGLRHVVGHTLEG